MEILKKTTCTIIILTLTVKLFGQSNTVLQKALRSSYADESDKNYAAAIADVTPYYSDNNYEINLRLGWLHYLNKNYTASQGYYIKAVNLRPTAIEPKFGYIKPLAFLQSWDKVLGQYQDILKIEPTNAQANYWVGVIYYNRKQFAASLKYFKVVIALYPFDYDGNHMMGWASLMAGKKDDAKAYFEKALLIKPGDESSSDGLNRLK